jgi:putative SOS response-associated peptidase YedK
MCGRFTLRTPTNVLIEQFELDFAPQLKLRFNIAPTQDVAVVRKTPDDPQRQLVMLHWGLIPSWAKEAKLGQWMINARGETVAEKPSFRAAFKRRRCLVVADGFYEWTPRKQGHRAHWLHPRQAPLLAFAGLHEQWSVEHGPVIDSCTVITTEANGDLAGIHARMPVVLAATSWRAWLDPGSEPEALQALLVPAPDGTLEARVVGTRVNDPRHDDPSCLESAPGEAVFRLDGGPSR